MPLSERDRQFLQRIDRLRVYLLVMAGAVLLVFLLMPKEELQLATSVIGIALCGVFWLTQRLLTYISALDLELLRIMDTIQRLLPEEERRKLLSKRP